ncbi:hypothetical protein [Streptomyces sp. NPDC050704]|uniref:phage scaffolding protein n=1 Tax=Streptomyces sp. NPDC050704 TaxID=3157219 RepID=UPI003439DAA1
MAPRTLARSRIHTPGWAHPAWYRGGAFSPVFYADGDPTAEPDGAPEDEPEPQTEPEDDWTPPTREEWETHQAKLKTASGEAAARRKFLRANGIDPKTGQKVNQDLDPEPAADPEPGKDDQPRGLTQAEVQRAVDKAVTETQLKGTRQMRTFTVGFNKALSEAGWNGTRLDSLMKLLDLDDVDIDDGEITGLSDQIDAIKSEWPEFFRRNRSANPSNGTGGSGQNGVTPAKIDAADKKPPAPEPKDWVEKLARQAARGA